MNFKTFIKLGNKSFNISKIDYIEFFEDDLIIEIKMDTEKLKFKIKDQSTFNRLQSLIKMYSTEFLCELEKIDDIEESSKEILND